MKTRIPRVRSSAFALGAALLLAFLPAGCGDPVASCRLSIDLEVEAVTPSRAPSSGGTEVTVVGQNFQDGLEVWIGEARAQAVVVHDEKRLSFVTPALPVGPKDLRFVLPDQAREVPRGLVVYAEDIGFSGGEVLAQGIIVAHLIVGDTDGDGLDDLVALGSRTVDGQTTQGLYSLVNQDQGKRLLLRQEIPAAIGTEPWTVLLDLADVSGDGLADLLAEKGVYVALGEGRFGEPLPIPCPGEERLQQARALHYDGDGRREIAAFCPSGLFVWRLEPGQGLSPVAENREVHLYDVALELLARYPVPQAKDVDRDGDEDLVYFGDDARFHLVLSPATSLTGQWASDDWTHSKPSLASFSVQDLNGDGLLDLAANTHISLEIFYSQEGKPFSRKAPRTAPCSDRLRFPSLIPAREVAPERVGQPLGVLCAADVWGLPRGEYRIYAGGKKDLSLVATYPATVGFNATMRMANLDGDDYVDLLVPTRDQLPVLYGASKDSYSDPFPSVLFTHGAWPVADTALGMTGVAAGDFGGGPRLAAAAGRTVRVLGLVDSGLRAEATLELGDDQGLLYGIGACDLDGQGTDDLVLLDAVPIAPRDEQSKTYEKRIHLLPMIAGGFGAAQTLPFGQVSVSAKVSDPNHAFNESLRLGDLDADGRCDLLLVWSEALASGGGVIPWKIRARAFVQTDAGFEDRGVQELGDGNARLSAADLDGDGDLDLYESVGMGREAVSLFVNNGQGQFEERELLSSLRLSGAVSPLTIDGVLLTPRAEGGFDAWIQGWELSTALLVRGRLTDALSLEVGAHAYLSQLIRSNTEKLAFFLRGDWNGDELPDAMLVTREGSTVVGLGSDAELPLEVVESFELYSFAKGWLIDLFRQIEAFDLDGDGLDDVITSSPLTRGKLTWVRNESR